MENFVSVLQRPVLGLFILGVSFASSTVYAEGCTSIASVPVTITASGMYCLADDLVFSTYGAAIDVQADDVTLDFKGHEIKGSFVQNMIGVAAGASVANVVIRNGKITNARIGVIVGRNALVENMIIKDVVTGVSVAGEYSVIRNNLITDVVPKFEVSSAGIFLSAGCGSLVENNRIRNFRSYQGALSQSTYGNGIRNASGCGASIRNNFIIGTTVSGAGEAVGIYDDGSASVIIGNRFMGSVSKNLRCGNTARYKDNISSYYGLYDCQYATDLGGNL